MSVTKTWKVQFMYKNDLGAVDKLLSSRLAAFSLFMGGGPVSFNGQDYETRGLELATRHYSGYKTNLEKFLY